VSDGSPEIPPIPPHIAQQATVTRNLFNDPKTKLPFLKLLKEQNPNLVIDELEQVNRVHETLAPALKRVEEAETRLIKREAQLADRELRSELLERGVVSRDAFPEVEKFQTERGITHFKDAAELYAMNQKAAPPRTAPSPVFTAPGGKDAADLLKNRKVWALNKAYEVMNEYRR
jgi:hypothetical protein